MATDDWDAYENWARGPGDPEKHRVQDAINELVRRLDSEGEIDAGRVAITGLSFGAETVCFSLFSMPKLAAAIARGGCIEPMYYYLAGDKLREYYGRHGFTNPEGVVSTRWRNLSVGAHVAEVHAPLLINASDEEFRFALQTVTDLKDAKHAVEIFVYPEEHHLKSQPAPIDHI